MGTHPIFESDFDCLTESRKRLALWIGLRESEREREQDGVRITSEIKQDTMAFDSYSNVSKPYDTWNGGFSGDITAGSNGIASSPLSISSSSGSTGGGSILPELAQIKQQPQQDFSKGGHTRTMHLPAERTGAVIGKNGRMKHLIKEVCNVWMSIKSEPSDSDNSTRVCVIRGPTINNLDHERAKRLGQFDPRLRHSGPNHQQSRS